MNSLLEELLNDQSERWQHNEACTILQLLASRSVPLETLSSNDLLDLVCNEVRWRELAGQLPTLEEYQRLFPQIHKELATQWQVNVLLDTNSQQDLEDKSATSLDGFGRYEILREVGRGAMGIVYEAYDRQLRRIVALKCLRSEFGRGSIEFERFENEAESIGKLKHHNLVQVYDFGFNNDSPYIVMEFCSGGTLAERLTKPMAASEAVDLLISIASAVGEAHAAGIIHRDLKPANILLLEANQWPTQVKVSDFGLAKSLDVGTSATLTGSILGSPAYMPPEQAVGDRKLIGPASDVYSLGAILFQCLTARPPFVGDSIADVLYQVQYDDPLLIRQLNPRTPRALETIVAKCLSKSASERYANATELGKDLTRYRSGLAILARPERLDQKLRRIARRHRMSTALVSISLLLLLGLVVSSLIYSARLRVALTESQKSAKLALLEKADGLLARAKGQRVSNRPGRRLIAQDVLQEAIQIGKDLQQPDSWFRPYRDEVIETMWLSDLCIREWRKYAKDLKCADFSPTGRLACIVYSDGNLEIREWDTDTVLATGNVTDPVYLKFLDEEHFLALANDGVACYRLSGNKVVPKWNFTYQEKQFKNGFWIDEKREQLLVSVTDKLLLIDLTAGSLISEVSHGLFTPGFEVAFHPQEPIYLITCYESRAMEIRDLITHRMLCRMKDADDFNGATGAVWNPSGSEFLLIDGEGLRVNIYTWDREQQTASLRTSIDPAKTMQGPLSVIGGGVRVRWPEDGKLLTHSSWAGIWAIHDSGITRTEIRTPVIASFTEFSNLPHQFDSGRHRVGMASSPLMGVKDAGPLELALGTEQRRLTNQAIDINHHLVFSHDATFAVGFAENRLWFFDLANGSEIGSIDLGITPLVSLALDSQNRLYLVSPDIALAFELELSDSRILLKSAKRIPVPWTDQLCLSISVDDKTMVAGAWAGYHSARYAGTWIRTPDEPTFRKILHGQSGYRSSIDKHAKNALVFSGFQTYRITLPSLETILLGPTNKNQTTLFNSSEPFAIAGGKLWRTDNWQAVSDASDSSDGSAIGGFSLDGTERIYTNKQSITLLSASQASDFYLSMEGNVVFYDSKHGTILLSQPDGLYFRDLRKAAEQLGPFGLVWDGPEFQEGQPLDLNGVELSPELASLATYTQWVDYLDAQAIKTALLTPQDGHALFVAAMVHIDRCEYDVALELLRQCSQLLPNAITPFQWQAYILAAQHRWPEAITAASKFIDASNDVEMRLQRASWYLEVHQPELAIEDANRAIGEILYLPRRARAIKLLAYELLNDQENVSVVQRELDVDRPSDGKYASSLQTMVTTDISLRNRRLAAGYARQILAPDDPELAAALAWTSLRDGDYEAALRFNKRSDDRGKHQADSPDAARSLAIQVMCNVQLGKPEIASQQLAELKLLQPTVCTDAWYAQAREIRLLIAEAQQLFKEVIGDD